MTGTSGPTTAEHPFPSLPEPGATPVAWYRRGPVLFVAAIAVIVIAALITDLPTHASLATNIEAETAVIQQINTDLSPCVFAVGEALTLRADETSGTLTSAHRAQIPGLLRDDQDACSLTSQTIFDLSDVEVPGGAAGRDVGSALNTATIWATSDALGAIETIQALTSGPDAKAKAQLVVDKRLMSSDRDKVTADIQAAGRLLRTNLPLVNLST